MELHIGTSGWLYNDWNGRFYPKGTKDIDKLPYFATQFLTVEINSTFYHSPASTSVQRWYDITPPHFIFAIKMNRYLTHTKRLLPDKDYDKALHDFFSLLRPLKNKLGAVLVQLPPRLTLGEDRIEHLAVKVRQFEQEFGQRFPLAIEFRHVHPPEVFGVLRKHAIANVIIDSPGRWPVSFEITSDIAYIRFHGSRQLYRSSYTTKELKRWARFVIEKCAACSHVFIYFNNDYGAVAIDNAHELYSLLRVIS
jgi:uncharacterized protein YecE (DUF72 family)